MGVRPSDAGEALCLFVTKSVPVVALMQCVILDLYNAQLPEHKVWFKETREARFGSSLEQAGTHHMADAGFSCSALAEYIAGTAQSAEH